MYRMALFCDLQIFLNGDSSGCDGNLATPRMARSSIMYDPFFETFASKRKKKLNESLGDAISGGLKEIMYFLLFIVLIVLLASAVDFFRFF
ncbi:hypothetical protein HF668_04110 [Acidithiobacillus ferridurans]|uniref:hypothetical protein n=1 Tax=Acidithiobacillus ferridurans TaxID=1232575 RepID=UPI001C07D150|nr:hypothetical protein [Acidithiobacillus ferridurans]MBU2804353.1 hypothetical protein [Acidithiobacillus ferridurans]